MSVLDLYVKKQLFLRTANALCVVRGGLANMGIWKREPPSLNGFLLEEPRPKVGILHTGHDGRHA
jgi:hypothetical protein